MYTVEELCYIMDEQKPDIMKNLKRSKYIHEAAQTRKDLNEEELVHYNEHMKGLMGKYSKMKNWRKILGSSLKYKRPFLANGEALLMGNQ